MFKSKPSSLSPSPSGPNSIQTELPFSFSSPLKSGVIRSRLNFGVPTSHLNPFPTGPRPIPEAAVNLSTSPDQAAQASAVFPGLGVIHLAVNRPGEGSSVIKGSLGGWWGCGWGCGRVGGRAKIALEKRSEGQQADKRVLLRSFAQGKPRLFAPPASNSEKRKVPFNRQKP